MDPSRIPERTFNGTLEEEVFGFTYPSGLRAFLCRKPGFQKRYACYSTFYGSADREFILPVGTRCKVPDGIAHFLEHSLFETEEGNASDLFALRGAYSNASTSFTTTTYLFQATDCFYENLELLLGFVESGLFPAPKVEKERGIIEQEILGYQDDPHWVGYMGLLENLFEAHPVRIDIAGTVESIRGITPELLQLCYRAFYAPRNMILCAVGDVEPGEFFDFVARTSKFETRPAERSDDVRRIYPDEGPRVFRRETRKTMTVALPKLLLGFKDVPVPRTGEAFVLHDLGAALALEILFGRSSGTYRDLYESGLILDDFGANYHLGAGVGYGLIEGETPEPDRLRDTILERLANILSVGIPPEDFERSKRMFLGGFVRAFNSLDYIARSYTFFKFHDFDLFRAIDLLAKIDRETMEERVRALLDPRNHASFVVLPGVKA